MRLRARLRLLRMRTSARRRATSRRLLAYRSAAAARARRVRDVLAEQRERVARLALATAKGGAIVVATSLLLASGAFAAVTLHGQFGGARATDNARTWAARTVSYVRTSCAACHPRQVEVEAASFHADVRCESCHGPLTSHPGNASSGLVTLATPTSAICTTCHLDTGGRAGRFPVIDPVQHYGTVACLRCHDPHTAAAVAPPDVTHPLTNLPACTTCHSPDGLKKLPAGHELVADGICLGCHRVADDAR